MTGRYPAPKHSLIRWLASLAGLIALVGFIALGNWQLERRSWKLDLMQQVNTRVHTACCTVHPPWLAFTPRVYELDAWWHMKSNGFKRPTSGFLPIHMPKNTAAGMVISGISALFGFAMIWHMWLIAGLSFVGLIVAIIIHTFNYKRDYYIPAEEVEQVETQFDALANGNSNEVPA